MQSVTSTPSRVTAGRSRSAGEDGAPARAQRACRRATVCWISSPGRTKTLAVVAVDDDDVARPRSRRQRSFDPADDRDVEGPRDDRDMGGRRAFLQHQAL